MSEGCNALTSTKRVFCRERLTFRRDGVNYVLAYGRQYYQQKGFRTLTDFAQKRTELFVFLPKRESFLPCDREARDKSAGGVPYKIRGQRRWLSRATGRPRTWYGRLGGFNAALNDERTQ
jgi:hypothetical protein